VLWCIELEPKGAAEAKGKLQKVIVGNIEAVEMGFPEEHFDVLILSEVLEHLSTHGRCSRNYIVF